MKTQQLQWVNGDWIAASDNNVQPQVALLFGSRPTIESSSDAIPALKSKHPNCEFITVSSAGNIMDEQLLDEQIVATLIELESSKAKCSQYDIQSTDAFELGAKVASDHDTEDLANLLLFSTTGINAGKLLEGGILLACHHGLTTAMKEHVKEQVSAFLGQF